MTLLAQLQAMLARDQALPACGFPLTGTLLELTEQTDFLRRSGFVLGHWARRPALRSETDYRRALRLLWKHRVAGWWHYFDAFKQHGICTPEEYLCAVLTR